MKKKQSSGQSAKVNKEVIGYKGTIKLTEDEVIEREILSKINSALGPDFLGEELFKRLRELISSYDAGYFYCPYIPLQIVDVKA